MFKTARPLVSINGIKWVMSPIWIGSSSWSSPEIKTVFSRFLTDYLTKTLILQLTFKLHKKSFSSFTSLYNLISKLLHKKTCTWSKTSFVQLTQNCKTKVFRQKKFEFFNRMVRVNKSKYAFKSLFMHYCILKWMMMVHSKVYWKTCYGCRSEKNAFFITQTPSYGSLAKGMARSLPLSFINHNGFVSYSFMCSVVCPMHIWKQKLSKRSPKWRRCCFCEL